MWLRGEERFGLARLRSSLLSSLNSISPLGVRVRVRARVGARVRVRASFGARAGVRAGVRARARVGVGLLSSLNSISPLEARRGLSHRVESSVIESSRVEKSRVEPFIPRGLNVCGTGTGKSKRRPCQSDSLLVREELGACMYACMYAHM